MQLRLALATVLGIFIGLGIAFVVVCKLIEHNRLVYNTDKEKDLVKIEFYKENSISEDGDELIVWA